MLDSTGSTKGNILLIDDLPENLKLLTDLLSQLGYVVRSAVSGVRAIKSAKSKCPDIVLLDINMPEMNGYQVCEAFKNDVDLCHIPIIFISALDEKIDILKAFQVGGVDYVTKPFQIEEVAARIEAHLTIQRQQKALQSEIIKRQEVEEVLYQSRALLSSVLNTALDGIAAMQAVRDPITGTIEDFRCLVINPIISKVLKRSREELIGKLTLKRLLKNLDSNLFAQFVKVVETGEPLDEDFYYPAGESFWYHYIAVKLGDGFAVTVRDVTARKKMEIELQEANQKLQQLANLDGLTRIANRRRFDEHLAFEWQRHYREKQSLSLIFIDIDYFKSYNDYYGHQQGDKALIQVAQTLTKTAQRATDFTARYGGEEFVVILPTTTREDALRVAESIRLAIAALAIPHIRSEISDNITASLGGASLIPSAANRLEDLIYQADQALYQAKTQGRNRCAFET